MRYLTDDAGDLTSSDPHLVACAFALGPLDGALRTLSLADETLLAATVVGRTLAAALDDAGYTDADRALARWLPTGVPPLADFHAVLSPSAVTQVVLHQLEHASWRPLADCARVLRRAVPHLTASGVTSPTAIASELTDAWAILAQAQSLSRHDPADDVSATLYQFAEHVSAASNTSTFARGQADPATMSTPRGVRSYYRSPPRPHSWALNLIVGDALHQSALLSRAIPLRSGISIGALRVDLTPGERRTTLFQSLTTAALGGLRMVEACRLQHAHFCASLAHLRSTSRAPAILAVLAGVGPLTRMQIAQGFSISRQGVDVIVDVLIAAGLVQRGRGTITANPWNAGASSSERQPTALVALASLAEVDDALAALDAILAKSGKRDHLNGS